MPGRISRRALWIGAAVAIILLALFLPPFVNVNRYRNRVATSIGSALGREVTVSGIELKLLPRPGMVLSNFIVADDPSYGPEPMLRADTVTAYLRLSSLWRGRLEIGTLELDNPSLNLVRRDDGHWNLEELVERASQVPSAPTTKTQPESRPRFPYVEATAGRVNFKIGLVKKAFAFTDADFALWLASEREWGLRLEARPMRTDVAINDTGILKLEGRFERASGLRNTPLNLKLDFSKGQLGQVTKLLYGRDRGWRGGVSSSATLSGTPVALGITFDAQVADFRRYDIALGEALLLRTHCSGTYASPDDSIRDIQCESPVRPGTIRVRGNVQGWGGQTYDLGVTAEQIPMNRVIALARHTKKDLPSDLAATGEAEAVFSVRKTAESGPVWAGGGKTTQFALQSGVLKKNLELGEVQFAIPETTKTAGKRPRHALQAAQPPSKDSFRVVVKPFSMPLGATSPATASGYFDRERYDLALKGDAELTRLMEIAKALGFGAPAVGLAGRAEVDLQIIGVWNGFAPPSPSGRLQMHDATAEMQGINEPLQILAATAVLAEQSMTIQRLRTEFAGGPEISGTATLPLICNSPESCILTFDLHSPGISLVRLNQLVNPAFQSGPWYRLLAIGQRKQDALIQLRTSGRFSVGRLQIGVLEASDVSGAIALQDGHLSVKELTGDLLGGHHTGNWDADFTSNPPKFFGSGALSKIAMTQVAALTHDNWATGTVGGQYTLGLEGLSAAALRDSAAGSADFRWDNGSLRHIALEGNSAPLAFSKLEGKVALEKGSLRFTDGRMQSASGAYALQGTVSFTRQVNLQLDRAGAGRYIISGPLGKPNVEPATQPSSEAKLQ